MLDGVVGIGEVVPGLAEGEVAVVLEREEDGEGGEEEDAQIPLPHLAEIGRAHV